MRAGFTLGWVMGMCLGWGGDLEGPLDWCWSCGEGCDRGGGGEQLLSLGCGWSRPVPAPVLVMPLVTGGPLVVVAAPSASTSFGWLLCGSLGLLALSCLRLALQNAAVLGGTAQRGSPLSFPRDSLFRGSALRSATPGCSPVCSFLEASPIDLVEAYF